MTADELRIYLNEKFGLDEWPKTLEVDHETYANCCQRAFNLKNKKEWRIVEVMVGASNGLMFKGVELILKEKK